LYSLSQFSQPFIVECDAFDITLGYVLIQNQQPINFEITKLINKDKLLSLYDKEMHALEKFKQYLLGKIFIIGPTTRV
jgi:hypothetical protein